MPLQFGRFRQTFYPLGTALASDLSPSADALRASPVHWENARAVAVRISTTPERHDSEISLALKPLGARAAPLEP
jgi:hypothetical protein